MKRGFLAWRRSQNEQFLTTGKGMDDFALGIHFCSSSATLAGRILGYIVGFFLGPKNLEFDLHATGKGLGYGHCGPLVLGIGVAYRTGVLNPVVRSASALLVQIVESPSTPTLRVSARRTG